MFKKQKATKSFRATTSGRASKKKPASKKVAAKAKRKTRTKKLIKSREVAVWDVDVHSGYLNRVLDAINRRQRLFRFTRIEATVPMGLTISGDRTRAIVKKYGGDFKSPDIGQNVLAEDIYRTAQPILDSVGTELLVCLLTPMIMDYLTKEEDGKDGIGWNFTSVSDRRIVLVSAFGLRGYAAKAKRPFEACLAAWMVAQVFVEAFSQVEVHDDTRGCIMDYCENRDDNVKALSTIGICEETVDQIPLGARESALKILDAIREYQL